MRIHKAAGAVLAAACLFGAATASATAAEQSRTASSGATTSATTTQGAANTADIEFVAMMIPHHYQAVVMGDLVPASADEDVSKLAERIAAEQTVEISTMQGWQAWNGLPVTDAQQAYEDLLEQPEMLEQMGMATEAEMDQLSAAEGTTFDVMFLELMIPHHEGAMDMAVDVITHGSDPFVQQMATDILTTQDLQIQQMEAMLADLTS